MVTRQTQLKINLPLALKEHLESKANKFGLPMATYVRHLILKEVENEDFPIFHASKATEKAAQKALEELSDTKSVTNIHEYLQEL